MRYCGREFSDADLACIRRIAAGEPGRTRRAISRLVCEEFGWRKPDGGLKPIFDSFKASRRRRRVRNPGKSRILGREAQQA